MVLKNDCINILQSILDVVGFILLSLLLILQTIIKAFLPNSYNNLKSLKGEIILITGGGGGLGRLIALRLARLEAIIVLWDVNVKAVEETVNLIKGVGGVAYGFQCDLADRDNVYKIAEKTRQQIGDITILINNAGVVSGNLLLQTPDHLIQRTFDVNVLAHFWTTKAFLPKMIENDHGHIVTIASMAGFVGVSKLVDYCSSKYAAVGFDEALKIELESEGVRGVKTTVICPYFIQQTGMFGNVSLRFLPQLKSNYVADRVVEGLRKDENVVMIPGLFRLGIIMKYLVPWPCFSMFLRNLVPDVMPHSQPITNSTTTTTTTITTTTTNTTTPSVIETINLDGHTSSMKSSLVHNLNQRTGVIGKNL